MTTPPTASEDGPVWVKGKTLNELSTAITERTVIIQPRWKRVIRATEKPEGIEIELDMDAFYREYGTQVYFVKDGVAVSARFLVGEATPA